MSKHLSLSERSIIESMLNKDFTFTQIAKKLGRTASTISREVHKHRVFTGKFDNYTHNDCIYFFSSYGSIRTSSASLSALFVFKSNKKSAE